MIQAEQQLDVPLCPINIVLHSVVITEFAVHVSCQSVFLMTYLSQNAYFPSSGDKFFPFLFCTYAANISYL